MKKTKKKRVRSARKPELEGNQPKIYLKKRFSNDPSVNTSLKSGCEVPVEPTNVPKKQLNTKRLGRLNGNIKFSSMKTTENQKLNLEKSARTKQVSTVDEFLKRIENNDEVGQFKS